MMGLYTDEDTIFLETKSPIVAAKQGGRVELWCEEGELFYGNLPENATAEEADRAYKFYMDGHEQGFRYGEINMQRRFRQLIGAK